MDIRAQQSAVLFKPVEGGYVFRVPYRLGFGAVPHYLVDERQKAELADAIAGPHPLATRLALAFAAVGAAMIAAFVVFALSPHKNPTLSDTLAMIALSLVTVAAGFAAWCRWKLRQLAPLLARLPRTDLRITRREMRAAMTGAMSVRQLWFTTIAFAFAAVMNLFSAAVSLAAGQSSGSGSAISGVMFTALGIYYGRLLIGRLRTRRAAG